MLFVKMVIVKTRVVSDTIHLCEKMCHEGRCGPCSLTSTVRCRCGSKTKVGVKTRWVGFVAALIGYWLEIVFLFPGGPVWDNPGRRWDCTSWGQASPPAFCHLSRLTRYRCRRAGVHVWETLQQETLLRSPQVRRAVLRGEHLLHGILQKQRNTVIFINKNCFVQNVEHKCLLICGYKLNCGLHRCQEPCHRGNCAPCWQSSEYAC